MAIESPSGQRKCSYRSSTTPQPQPVSAHHSNPHHTGHHTTQPQPERDATATAQTHTTSAVPAHTNVTAVSAALTAPAAQRYLATAPQAAHPQLRLLCPDTLNRTKASTKTPLRSRYAATCQPLRKVRFFAPVNSMGARPSTLNLLIAGWLRLQSRGGGVQTS